MIRIGDEDVGESSREWDCSESKVMVQETLSICFAEKNSLNNRHDEDSEKPRGGTVCCQIDDMTQERRNESKDVVVIDGRRGEDGSKRSDKWKGYASGACPPTEEMMKETLSDTHGEDEMKESNPESEGSHDDVRGWHIQANPAAVKSNNPIRKVLESWPPMLIKDGKREIPLAGGDPSTFGNLKPPVGAVEALINAAKCYTFNGYVHSKGLVESRRVIANCHSLDFKLTADDIYITVGCAQAIRLCIEAFAFPGSNILLPKPGFPVYETFTRFYGLQSRQYNLLPEQDWEVDLEHMEKLADSKTVALVICNPGNPSGAVYRREHLSQIAEVAIRLKIPIIADEIYAHLAFGNTKFIHMATFSKKVPVLATGGISKRWMIPGWRLGWIIVHDPHGILKRGQVIEALTRLVQMSASACTVVQAVVPNLLLHTSSEYYKTTLTMLKLGADLCVKRVQQNKSLSCPSAPEGGMFMMVKIDVLQFTDLRNDVEFSAALRHEELVIVLPGTAFGMTNWIRIAFVAPLHLLQEAWDRIDTFCQRHAM